MLSDLSGQCYHDPIEFDLTSAFLAKYSTFLQVCSCVLTSPSIALSHVPSWWIAFRLDCQSVQTSHLSCSHSAFSKKPRNSPGLVSVPIKDHSFPSRGRSISSVHSQRQAITLHEPHRFTASLISSTYQQLADYFPPQETTSYRHRALSPYCVICSSCTTKTSMSSRSRTCRVYSAQQQLAATTFGQVAKRSWRWATS